MHVGGDSNFLEKEKENARHGKFAIEDIVEATKKVIPDIWIDEPK